MKKIREKGSVSYSPFAPGQRIFDFAVFHSGVSMIRSRKSGWIFKLIEYVVEGTEDELKHFNSILQSNSTSEE